MNNTVKNILAIPAGLMVGSLVNFSLIIVGSFMVPAPEGVDVMDAGSIAASLHLYTPLHFLFPFIAHALGTFVGALVTYNLAGTHKKLIAMVIGGIFLVGGITNSFLIPAPVWFIVVDLIVAYIPMAWLATLLKEKPTAAT